MSTKAQADGLTPLSMKEIIARPKGVLTFSRDERQKKNLLLEKVVKRTPPEQVEFLRNAALQKKRGGRLSALHQKRKREEEDQPRGTVQCLDEGGEPLDGAEESEDNPSKYLVLPTEERKACYYRFYEATSSGVFPKCDCASLVFMN